MKLNEKKGDRGLEQEIKNKEDIFLLEEQHENFVAAVTKWEMLAATNASEPVNGNTYGISSVKHVTKKFLEVSCCGRAKQRRRNVQKKVCCTCGVAFFLLIRPIIVFYCSPALPSPLISITRFYILFEQTINIIESFVFSPG